MLEIRDRVMRMVDDLHSDSSASYKAVTWSLSDAFAYQRRYCDVNNINHVEYNRINPRDTFIGTFVSRCWEEHVDFICLQNLNDWESIGPFADYDHVVVSVKSAQGACRSSPSAAIFWNRYKFNLLKTSVQNDYNEGEVVSQTNVTLMERATTKTISVSSVQLRVVGLFGEEDGCTKLLRNLGGGSDLVVLGMDANARKPKDDKNIKQAHNKERKLLDEAKRRGFAKNSSENKSLNGDYLFAKSNGAYPPVEVTPLSTPSLEGNIYNVLNDRPVAVTINYKPAPTLWETFISLFSSTWSWLKSWFQWINTK